MMIDGVTWGLFLAGPTVAAGYLLSSLTRTWVVRNGDRPSQAVVVEVATVILAASVAWLAIRSQAPGQTIFQNASAIGFLSSQVLTAWSSLALWTGLAAVVGHLAPLQRRFGDGTAGVAGAAVLLLAFLPITVLAGIGAWISSIGVTRETRSALPLTYGAVVVAEWLFSVVNPPGPWGIVHGPESTLFVAATAGALLFRWSKGDVGIAPLPSALDRDEPR